MNGSVFILFYKVFVQKNRVLVVVTFPCHEADKHIFAERKFAVVGRRTVRKNLSRFNALTLFDDDMLVYAGCLVRTEEFGCKVSVEDALIVSYENFTRICLFNNTAVLARIQTPESVPALYSIPVPTMGASVLMRGTA